MSVRPLTVIDTGYRKITKAVTDFDQATDKKLKARAKETIKPALKDYLNDMIIMIAKKDLLADPYGILFSKNLQHGFMKFLVEESLLELHEEVPEMSDAIDDIMCKAVEDGLIAKWTIKCDDKVEVKVSKKKVKIFVDGVKSKIKWQYNSLKGIVQWLRENLAKIISSIPFVGKKKNDWKEGELESFLAEVSNDKIQFVL